MARYDTIGHGYARKRQPDPRIATRIGAALEGCESILNVGAGTGSYEPAGRRVVAVEPSAVMIGQRTAEAAPAVRGTAAALPFADASFDASLAVLTIHHWPDLAGGMHELRRTARKRVVLLTFDTSIGGFWLTDYFPEILELDAQAMPSFDELRKHLGAFRVEEVPVPHDCVDGFLGAYWRRPEAYLEPAVRNATSVFSMLKELDAGVERLSTDLASGEWQQRYGHLLERDELDLGYRLLVA